MLGAGYIRVEYKSQLLRYIKTVHAVPFVRVRSSRSSTFRYGWPFWFHTYQGGGRRDLWRWPVCRVWQVHG